MYVISITFIFGIYMFSVSLAYRIRELNGRGMPMNDKYKQQKVCRFCYVIFICLLSV